MKLLVQQECISGLSEENALQGECTEDMTRTR